MNFDLWYSETYFLQYFKIYQIYNFIVETLEIELIFIMYSIVIYLRKRWRKWWLIILFVFCIPSDYWESRSCAIVFKWWKVGISFKIWHFRPVNMSFMYIFISLNLFQMKIFISQINLKSKHYVSQTLGHTFSRISNRK